jgi:hypothetical protein
MERMIFCASFRRTTNEGMTFHQNIAVYAKTANSGFRKAVELALDDLDKRWILVKVEEVR